MITLADRSDLDTIVALVTEFLSDTAYNKYAVDVDHDRVKKLCWGCLQLGKVWISWDQAKATGLLMAIRESNVWIPEKISLKEMVWYVKPEYRNSTAAGRLFSAFCTEAEKQLNNGSIEAYFIGVMSSTNSIDFERRGFRLAERLYIKD